MHVAWMKFPQFMMIKKQTKNVYIYALSPVWWL